MDGKAELRSRLVALRQELSSELRQSKSHSAQQFLGEHPLFRVAQVIGLYRNLPSEVATEALVERALAEGKRVALPAISADGVGLTWTEIDRRSAFARHALGFEAPMGGATLPLSALDLMVVPGVAFDLAGRRLGLGKGFYDRALAHRSDQLVTVGLAFELQLVDEVPAEAHDVRLDWLVTEVAVRPCRAG